MKFSLSSKWSYLMCGVNVMVALLGAVSHSLPLTLMGAVFTIWNWYVAEFNRRMEDETIRKESRPDTDSETEE